MALGRHSFTLPELEVGQNHVQLSASNSRLSSLFLADSRSCSAVRTGLEAPSISRGKGRSFSNHREPPFASTAVFGHRSGPRLQDVTFSLVLLTPSFKFGSAPKHAWTAVKSAGPGKQPLRGAPIAAQVLMPGEITAAGEMVRAHGPQSGAADPICASCWPGFHHSPAR